MSIPQLYPVYRLESFLQSIASADIAWMLRIRRQFLGVDDLGMLVDYVVFDMDTLADGCGREDDAVFDDAALFDDASSSDDRVLDGPLNETSIGDHRILHICIIEILGRAGVISPGVDGPFIVEQISCGLKVDQRNICVIVTLEICNGCKVTSVGYTADIQLLAGSIDNICQSIHGRSLLCLVYQVDEQLLLHDKCVHEDVAVLGISMILVNGKDSFLAVQI